MTQKKRILSVIAATLLGLSGCSNDITIKNSDQSSITIPRSPQKVVVMDFGAVDTFDALGVGQTITGLPQSNTPQYLAKYKDKTFFNTGNMKTPDIAAIKADNPNLIIIGGRQNSFYDELSKIAPVMKIQIDNKDYLNSVKNNITVLGNIANKQSAAKEAINSIDTKVKAVNTRMQNSTKNAIVVLHNDDKVALSNTSGYATLIHDVLGVKRTVPPVVLAANEKPTRVMVDNQYIREHKPSVIFVVDRSKAIGSKAMRSNFFDQKVLKSTGTQVVYLTADLWYLSGGGIESLNRQIDEVSQAIK